MDRRYERNMNMLSHEENKSLNTFNVCVVGCGGLGGYVIEMLSRLGIGSITAVDGDVFDETNLNRQLLSDERSIGASKAEKAKERVQNINSSVNVKPIVGMLGYENARSIVSGHDIVIDALDSIDARLELQKACHCENIPFIHGAIAGWYGQVSTIMPGDRTLDFIYGQNRGNGLEKTLGNPSFTPANVASYQVCEALKVLLGKGEILRGKILFIDMLTNEHDIVEVG